jgi:hypothetical protein
MKKKGSSCVQMKDHKGKPSGLMMEGSVAHQESAKQEKKDLMKDMPVDSKASAMEMSPYKMDHKGSPNKMSPLNDNHEKIDPRTGKKVDEFGTEIPEGFVSSMGENYDPASASNFYADRQRRADEALNIAQNMLTGGASANLGSISTDFPHAAEEIVGRTYDDAGQYRAFNTERTQGNIDRLRELNRVQPQAAFEEISARTRNLGSTIGEKADDWKMEVDPLNQFERKRSGWRNRKRKILGAPGQTEYQKRMARKNQG